MAEHNLIGLSLFEQPTFPRTSGIYAIIHQPTDRYYVGSTKCLRIRQVHHLSRLSNGTHQNRHLQRAWNRYGPSAFRWVILESVADHDALLGREQFWIEKSGAAKNRHGFNICPVAAAGRLGVHSTRLHRQRIAASLRGNRHAAGFHNAARLCPADVQVILASAARGECLHAISRKFKISHGSVRLMVRRKIWADVPVPDHIEAAISALVYVPAHGTRNGASKLTDDKVRELRHRLANGEHRLRLAKEFGIDKSTLYDIKKGAIWRHVT